MKHHLRRQPPTAVKKAILIQQGFRCFYCGSKFGEEHIVKGKLFRVILNWDHLLPVAYRADNNRSNYVAACSVCNLIKSSQIFNTAKEARSYVRFQRIRKGWPVSEVPKTIPQKEVVAKILWPTMPGEALLGHSPNSFEKFCDNCGRQFKWIRRTARFCCASCRFEAWDRNHPRKFADK